MLHIFSFIEVQCYGALVLDSYITVVLLSCNDILLQYYSAIVFDCAIVLQSYSAAVLMLQCCLSCVDGMRQFQKIYHMRLH